MKFNWGTGLFIFFVFFVLTLGFVLYKSRQLDNSLVVDKYYEEDINYQRHYDKIKNLKDLGRDIQLKSDQNARNLVITFPHGAASVIEGTITMYRASDKSKDVITPFTLRQDSVFVLFTGNMDPGKWKIKIDYQCAGRGYFKEDDIVL
jgi:hypothetical protein